MPFLVFENVCWWLLSIIDGIAFHTRQKAAAVLKLLLTSLRNARRVDRYESTTRRTQQLTAALPRLATAFGLYI